MKKIVIFASGSGTNAENIIKYFTDHESISVTQVMTNNRQAKVLERCKILQVSAFYFNSVAYQKTDHVLSHLIDINPDLIVLAGFLWKIPKNILDAFPDRIINIHPALLPKYGGKGMYGMYVHEAVINNFEKESGITIHYVNENYDEGDIIFQAQCNIDDMDTPELLALKIHKLEMDHFPKEIEKLLS